MSETDRRTVIADAALKVLGTEGARGLTHRSVDKEAELPAGSTSYYCRRRIDLLVLALQRHAELDHRDLVAESAQLAKQRLTIDRLADLASQQVTRWVSAHKRTQLIARFELFLAASREPELAAIIHQQRRRFVETFEAALGGLGASNAKATAQALIALIEGLLLEQVRAGGTLISASEIRSTVFAILSQDTT